MCLKLFSGWYCEIYKVSQLAIAAAVYGPSMQGKPERCLAATKHHHTHTFGENVCACVCVQSNITYKNAGFQWSPTHVIELQERSSIMPQTTSFLYCFICVFRITIGHVRFWRTLFLLCSCCGTSTEQ